MQDFRNLVVWREARSLVGQVYLKSRAFPEDERFGLRRQIRRAVVSIAANISEGCGRRGDREFRRFLDHAMGSACELECQLILCGDLGLLEAESQSELLEHIVGIKRMLAGLISSLHVTKRTGRDRGAES